MNFTAMPWCKHTLDQHAGTSVVALLSFHQLLESPHFPTASELNNLAARCHSWWQGPEFKAQSSFSDDESRYYEAIISEDNTVPTREESWHDLFNALVWIQYPKTKARLNALHMQDITAYGAHPRTPRRNRLTHFDECGVIFAVEEGQLSEGNDLLAGLAHHQWERVFVEQKATWEQCIHPFIFGHANFEMLLTPFNGLTAKWLSVKVPNGFAQAGTTEQHAMLDDAMCERISELDNFLPSALLKPVPLLGIPGWHHTQDAAFYANKDYFRPLSAKAKPTIQLPLA